MSTFRYLLRLELITALAVFACALVVAAIGAWDAYTHPNSILGVTDTARIGFLYTLVLGLPAACLFGAPLYLSVAKAGNLSVRTLVIAALTPGLGMMLLDTAFGVSFLICGPVVVAIVHFAMKASKLPD